MNLRALRTLVLVVLTGVALFVQGCAVNPATGRSELELIPISPEKEVALGREAYPQMAQKMDGYYKDPGLETYVNRVAGRLGAVSHRPQLNYQVKVLNSSVPNAFALPGGFMAISRGLLVKLENEAQLAAVLGHEIGHVTARHSVQAMQRGALYNIALAGVGAAVGNSPLTQQASQLAAGMLENSYSRGQESESDTLGIDYMVKAGYDPRGAVQLQEFFWREVEKGASPSMVTGLFRTHPFSKTRLDGNRAYIARTYPNVKGRLGKTEFKKATAGLKRSVPAYDLYDQAQEAERSKQQAKAIELYHQAVAKGPGQSLIHTALGLAYLRQEDLVPARRYLLKAVNLDGDYFESRYGLGYVYLQKNEEQRAVPQLEKGVKLLPTLQGAFLLAESYEKTGQQKKAYDLYQVVAQSDKGRLGQMAAERARRLGR